MAKVHDGGTQCSASFVGYAPGEAIVTAEVGQAVHASAAAIVVRPPSVSDVRAVRIHDNGHDLIDPVASTLYPRDTLEVTAHVGDLGKVEPAAIRGRVQASAPLFGASESTFDGKLLTVRVKATTELGASPTSLGVVCNELEPAAVRPIGDMRVVAAEAGEYEDLRVRTTSFDDAKLLILTQINAVLVEQGKGVLEAKKDLLAHDKSKVTWKEKLFLAAMESAVAFVTAGVGTRVGRMLSAPLGGDGPSLFDVDAAFTQATKDFFKKSALAAVSGLAGDGGQVSRDWAIALFCETQESQLKAENPELEAKWINDFDRLRKLEEQQPGAGLSEIEHVRRAFAEQAAWAKDAARYETIRAWLLHEAQTSHGVVPHIDPAVVDEKGDRREGADPRAEGAGEIAVTIRYSLSDPSQPVTVASISTSLREEVEARLFAQGGTILGLGLPIRVAMRDFTLVRNEIGDVWFEINNLSFLGIHNSNDAARNFLYTKGTGKMSPATGAELEEGMHAGVRRILDVEVGGTPTAGLPLGFRW